MFKDAERLLSSSGWTSVLTPIMLCLSIYIILYECSNMYLIWLICELLWTSTSLPTASSTVQYCVYDIRVNLLCGFPCNIFAFWIILFWFFFFFFFFWGAGLCFESWSPQLKQMLCYVWLLQPLQRHQSAPMCPL